MCPHSNTAIFCNLYALLFSLIALDSALGKGLAALHLLHLVIVPLVIVVSFAIACLLCGVRVSV